MQGEDNDDLMHEYINEDFSPPRVHFKDCFDWHDRPPDSFDDPDLPVVWAAVQAELLTYRRRFPHDS